MTISEVARRLDLDVSTVRFYERKGLVTPARREDSKYRDYSEDDIMTLKRIILYRKLDFSIEDIQTIMTQHTDIHDMLVGRRQKLLTQKKQLLASLALCDKMLDDNAGEDMEVDYYLSYVHEEERNGVSFPDIMPVLDRLADNMAMEKYLMFPFMPGLLQNVFTRRIAAVAAFAILVVFPVIYIIGGIVEIAAGDGSYIKLIVWCLYGLMTIPVFMRLVGNMKSVPA